MKFKLIILFFNFFILLSFAAVFFLPVSVLGWGYIAEFWSDNWLLPVFFIFLVVFLNIYFLSNWSILKHVEKGDWQSLVPVLEGRVFGKKRITYSNIRLLIHSYFLLSKLDRFYKLESLVKSEKPGLYKKSFLMFSSLHLVSDPPEKLESYLEDAYSDKRYKGMDWISMFYAFALLVRSKKEEASGVLKKLESTEKKKADPVLRLSALYFMSLCALPEENDVIESKKTAFTSRIPRVKFKKIFEKEKGELNVLFFSKLIVLAEEWAYSNY